MAGEEQTELYQAPGVTLEAPVQRQGKLPAAQRWRRVLNYLVDYIGMMLFVMALAFVLTLAGADSLIYRIETTPELLLGVAAMLLYYLPLEGMFGTTLGKLVTGTVVVTTDGRKASFGAVIGRTFCRFIPFEAFSIFSRGRVCWHDQIPGTKVVERAVLRRWLAGERVEETVEDDALPASDTSGGETTSRPAD